MHAGCPEAVSGAIDTYHKLIDPSSFTNRAARKAMRSLVVDSFALAPRGANRVAFGDFRLKGAALHAQQIQFRTVDVTRVDPLGAALGRFSFHLIPSGTARRPPRGRFDVDVTRIGVYVVDSFDFEDRGWFGGIVSQPLGFWKLPRGISDSATSLAKGYTYVNNKSYRDYRALTGRGGDFLVVTDVKATRLKDPVRLKL